MSLLSLEELSGLAKKYPLLPFLLIVSVTLISSLPFLNNRLGPDACNYLDIGANLAQGKGYTATILTWFAEPSPIVHSALIEKQPLFPLILAPFIYFFGMYRIVLLKAFFFPFYLGSLYLTYDWVRKKEGIKPAFFATLYLATSPIMNFAHFTVSNYFLFIFLLVLSSYIYQRKDNNSGALLLGLVAGLGYLTRLEGSLLFLFLAASYLIKKKWRRLIYFFLAFSLTISPLLIARELKYGDFNKSVHSFQYRTLYSASEVMWLYEIELKTFKELFTNYRAKIFKQIIMNAKNYSFLFFGSFGLFVFLIILFFFHSKYFKSSQSYHFIYLVILWLCSLVLRWPRTHFYDRSILTLPIIFILTPIYVIFLENFFQAKLSNMLASKAKYLMPLVIITTILINQVYARPYAQGYVESYSKSEANEKRLMQWINKNIPLDWPICTENYYLINYFTRRPTVNLPWNITPYNVDRFLKDYPIKVFIYDNSFISEVNIRGTAIKKNWSVFAIPKTTYQAIMLPLNQDD